MFNLAIRKSVIAVTSALLLTGAGTQAANASCLPGQPCMSWKFAPQSSSAVRSAPTTGFTSSNISSLRPNGLAPDEYLCPTKCAVDVYNPEGGQVLGCYDVCKVAKPAVQTFRPARYLRVLRPVVYVRQPVLVQRPQAPCQHMMGPMPYRC